jgi:hypothetical protein
VVGDARRGRARPGHLAAPGHSRVLRPADGPRRRHRRSPGPHRQSGIARPDDRPLRDRLGG